MEGTIGFETSDEELQADFDEKIEVVYPKSYEDLEDKPMINDVTLIGNTTLEELGVVSNDLTIAGLPLTGDISEDDLKQTLGVNENISDFPDASDYVKATDTESDDINFDDFDW